MRKRTPHWLYLVLVCSSQYEASLKCGLYTQLSSRSKSSCHELEIASVLGISACVSFFPEFCVLICLRPVRVLCMFPHSL